MRPLIATLSFVAALSLSLCWQGCTTELPDSVDRNIDIRITDYPEGVEVDNSGDTPVVIIPSTGAEISAVVSSSLVWNAKSFEIADDGEGNKTETANPSWCTITVDGDNLTIKVDGYFDESGAEVAALLRQGVVKVQIGNDPRNSISLRQGAEVKASVDIGTTNVIMPSKGAALEYEIKTNKQSTVTAELIADVNGDVVDWVTVDIESKPGYLLITGDSNSDSSERSTTMALSAGEGSNVVRKTITISQSNGSFVLVYNVGTQRTAALPVCGVVNCTVNWGDGSEESFDKTVNPDETSQFIRHTYSAEGEYKITIWGEAERLRSSILSADEKAMFKSVSKWGDIGLISLEEAFAGTTISSVASLDDNGFVNVANVNSMFRGCLSLTSVPVDFFSQCTDLTELTSVFEGCEKLGNVPSIFKNCANVTTFTRTFADCKKLTSVASDIFAAAKNAASFEETFSGCESLLSIPSNLFNENTKTVSFEGTFKNCMSLTKVDAGIFGKTPNAVSFNSTFMGCIKLVSVNAQLFNNCIKVTDFENLFNGCVELTGKSPYNISAKDNKTVRLYQRKDYPDEFTTPASYSGAFRDCTKLDDFETIQEQYAGWL